MHVFSIFWFRCQNRQKPDHSLMYPIAWAFACSSHQMLLLCGLIQSFIIAMLKLNWIIIYSLYLLHAGLHYNGTDCSGGWVVWLRLTACRGICQDHCWGICWGICWVPVWHLSGCMSQHLSGHLLGICMGISWSVCYSNCWGVCQDISWCICWCICQGMCQGVCWAICIKSINLHCTMYRVILSS